MTREDAYEIWLPIIKMGVKSMPECYEAVDMAIKALKQEPCTDAISRQAVLEVIEKCHCEEWVKADIGAPIEALQPVNPAEKVGKWIFRFRNGFGRALYGCSECNCVCDSTGYSYCPNCGAKMQEVEE